MLSKFCYHASKTTGLKTIEPHSSTHKKRWVYATEDIASSAAFLGENFDFICSIGTDNGLIYIFETFPGALEYAYKGKRGSIYKLDKNNFVNGRTSWDTEIVSTKPAKVMDEISVEDALVFLLDLEQQGKVRLYRYPDRPDQIPRNKEGIITRAVVWTTQFGEETLNQVEQFHPDVLSEVLNRLKESDYIPQSTKWKQQFRDLTSK